jgi:glycosyltransferase involved in cell wall biosynthesis
MGTFMNAGRLRILLLAPGSKPNSNTGALIGYSLGEALSRLHEVTFVIMARDEEAVRKSEGGFHAVESIPPSWLDRFYAWIFRRIFKENYGSVLWSALCFPLSIAFEWRAWKQLRTRIIKGEFDVVLRILPIDPKMPSPFAFFLRRGPIPFVIGPINGGLPWPKGFSQLDRQLPAAGYWAANLRSLYRVQPFARSTYGKATAIIAGGSNTCREFSPYRDKVFYVPGENGVNSSWVLDRSLPGSEGKERLELIMVNRLVPLKAVDLGLRGAASILREGRAHLSILGDGPERERLENLADDLGVRGAVTFCGWVSHTQALSRLKESDVLLFPSLREFGGGVVFEALAMGAVPVVTDFGGPGDIVRDEVGYRIPLTDEHQMAARIESVLENLASDRNHLETLRRQGAAYAREHLTWEAKARMVTEVLLWAVGAGPKPTMPPPRTALSIDLERSPQLTARR